MRKMRKQPAGPLDYWDNDAEAGERRYQWVDFGQQLAVMHDLEESRGGDKASSGVLTNRVVRKDHNERVAKRVDGIWYWVD